MTGPQGEPASRPTVPDSSVAACCTPADPRIARRFDAMAGDWVDAGEFPDMVDVSAGLLDLLHDAPTRRPTVLELGSGTGGLGVALLEMGAEHLTGIDLSPGSVEVAMRRAAEAGFGDRATFRAGNATDAPAEAHDWVILDRVICCFGEPDRLIDRAIALAGERIGLTAPESRSWRGLLNRPLWLAENIWDLWRGGCRGYVHDLRRVERRLASGGFLPVRTRRVGLWHVARYERVPNTSDSPVSRSRGA
jgi:magnesium-protoporphyrin O-methyltransferase